MRNLLAMGAAGLLVFAGLGWYLDWYRLQTTTTPDGKQHISVDVDTKKVSDFIRKEREGWLPPPQQGNLTPAPQGFTTPPPTQTNPQQQGFSVNLKPFDNGPNVNFNLDP